MTIRLDETGHADPIGVSGETEVEVFPASFAQARLWFLDRLNPAISAYVSDIPLRVRGPFDPDAFMASVHDVVARHEILRTTFAAVDGAAVQVVHRELAPQLCRHDLRGDQDPLAAARALAGRLAATPFDLATGPLVRLHVAHLAADDWAVLLAVHHIVVDGWSLGILLDELRDNYRTRVAGALPDRRPNRVQYADYSVWQHEHVSGERLEAQLGYWRERLRNAPRLTLPTARPRPQLGTHRGARAHAIVAPDTMAGLRALARQERATLFMVLLAGYAVVLRAWSGERDLVIGTPVSGRDQPELERMIGFFVNMLALRLDLQGQPSFRDAVRTTRQAVLEAFSGQDLPFERLVSELAPERELGRSPYFDVTFAFQTAGTLTSWPELELSSLAVPHETVKFDLSLTCADDGERVHAGFAYASDLFDAATIRRLAGSFVTLLGAAAAAPDSPLARLALLHPDEQAVVDAANDTAREVPGGRVSDLFVEQVARTPAAVAVDDGAARLTYRDLDLRSDRLAGVLRRAGVRTEQPVALMLDVGVDLVVAELAIWKAGAAFVPVDITTPPHRIAATLDRLTPTLGVTDAEHAHLLPPGVRPVLIDGPVPDEPLPDDRAPLRTPEADGRRLAYLIATSGTTGVPKLVEVEHRSLVNHLTWVNEHVLVDGPELPVLSSPAFDAVHKQLIGPLLRGGTVWLVPPAARLDPARLLDAIRARPHVAVNCVPTLWIGVLEYVESGRADLPASLDLLLLGGEAVTADVVERTFAAFPGIVVWNLYGPTETTVNALAGRLRPGEAVTIGLPVANADAHVVDADGAELPAGVPGELHVGGLVLARGYRDDEPATTRAFSTGAAPHRRYRTGDRAVRLPDGRIRFLGRGDDQVKVRGVRGELGEIVSYLRAHPAVRDAAVLERDGELAAFVVPASGDVPAAELRAYLAARLHPALVPASYTSLAALPRTAAGKLDRQGLPDRRTATAARPASATARTPAERLVAEVWTRLLAREPIGRDDNFFDLGGHSVLVVRAHTRLIRDVPALSVLDLFRFPTLRTLGARIDALQHADTAADA